MLRPTMILGFIRISRMALADVSLGFVPKGVRPGSDPLWRGQKRCKFDSATLSEKNRILANPATLSEKIRILANPATLSEKNRILGIRLR